MKGVRLVSLISFFCLSSLVQAQRVPVGKESQDGEVEERNKGLLILTPKSEPDATSALNSRTGTTASFTTPKIESSLSAARTQKRTSSSTAASLTTTEIPDDAEESPRPSTTEGLGPVPDGFVGLSSKSEDAGDVLSGSHRTLVIVLSTILGSIGIVLAVLVLFLVSRCRNRRAHRCGVSPINDDEIESWRNSDRKHAIPSSEGKGKEREHGSASLTRPVDWTTSPTSLKSPESAMLQRGASFHARAPNVRAGLTDEALPGAEPFVPQVKRQSSRLSKAPPGHRRTKSRRSSTSAKSVRSIRSLPSIDRGSFHIDDYRATPQTIVDWSYSDDVTSSRHIFAPTLMASSPATSIYNEVHEPGGLSPRPKSRPWDKMVYANDSIGKVLS